MESLALQYLGDSDRWIEIAAINGLQDPYVDETGFTVTLIANAAGNTATVADPSNLYIGQSVQIDADGLQTMFVVISGIEIVSDVEAVISFANNVNLNGYTTALNATLFAYLPDTVNSDKMVAIPSVSPVNVPGNIQLTPSPNDLSYITYLAKVDFLLTSSGDLAFTSGGDILTASGIQNLTQAANMKVQTILGTIISNPGFGNPVSAGTSVADMSASDILTALATTFAQDSRFSGLLAGQVNITGPAANLDLLVGVANSNVNLPISTQVPI